jgi:hypothetical protein
MTRTRGRSCAGKRRYRTLDEAFCHVKRLVAEGDDRLLLSVYRCKFCDWFHVGHNAPGFKP